MTDEDLLRRAANHARETANATPPGPWHVTRDPLGTHVENADSRTGRVLKGAGQDRTDSTGKPIAAHVALWHPGVALEVANWLLDEAHDTEGHDTANPYALAVARALIGEHTTEVPR